MRRDRRRGQSGIEFGGSGEDSFVAVVVTKLTGALLFILLLTMVIMALLPKAVDLPSSAEPRPDAEPTPLAIGTPEALPDAIAGRPYTLALAATGGTGPLRWSLGGELPAGLEFDPALGQIRGTPRRGTPQPAELILGVGDGRQQETRPARLLVFQSESPLTLPSRWLPGLPPVPWRAWLEQGFGFLVLWLVYLIGANAVANLERWSLASLEADPPVEPEAIRGVGRRFRAYRWCLRIAGLAAALGLAGWMRWGHA